MARAEEHIAELLKLSVDERAQAARVLLDSLYDGDPDEDAPKAQAEEIMRRLQALHDGTSTLIDGDEARERILARLREMRGR